MVTRSLFLFVSLWSIAIEAATTNGTKFLRFEDGVDSSSQDGLTKQRGIGRIVNGQPAEEDRYPYMATLVTNSGDLVCGGTLISPSYVLSAAHCSGYASKVYIGRYELNDPSGAQTVDIEKEIVFRRYDPSTDDGDYMLIRLKEKVNDVTFPSLSTSQYTADFTACTALTTIGWGAIYSGGPISNTLLEAEVNYVPQITCQNLYSPFDYPVTAKMICAGGIGDKDSCQGDSGGPLFVKGTGAQTDVQVGITSWGVGCADGYPGVYSRVSQAKRWITRTLKRSGETPDFVSN